MFCRSILNNAWDWNVRVARSDIDNDTSTQIAIPCASLYSSQRLGFHHAANSLCEEQRPFHVDIEKGIELSQTSLRNLVWAFDSDLSLISKCSSRKEVYSSFQSEKRKLTPALFTA